MIETEFCTPTKVESSWAEKCPSLGLSPCPVAVSTRIIVFLGPINHHFYCYWEGGQPKPSHLRNGFQASFSATLLDSFQGRRKLLLWPTFGTYEPLMDHASTHMWRNPFSVGFEPPTSTINESSATLERKWRNSRVFFYHGPLLSHLLGVAPSTFTMEYVQEI